MINAAGSASGSGSRGKEEQPLDKIIGDETLEKLVDIFRSFGKNDAEIEESLVKDLHLSRQRLKRFLRSGTAERSGRDGHRARTGESGETIR